MNQGLKIVTQTLNKHLDCQLRLALKNRQKMPESLRKCVLFLWCLCAYVPVSMCLWKNCLYCFMVFAKMLLKVTEIPHGFGKRTSTYTRVHTHSSGCKHSAEVCSLLLWQLHCAYQLLLSFIFPI